MAESTIVDFPSGPTVLEEFIPDILKNTNRWMVWRWETRGKKSTKPPYRIDGKRAQGPKNPDDWVTLEQAISAVKTGKFSGIGFVLTDDDDITAYDLDHCLNTKTGNLEPWAQDLVTKLNSYTEVTPSGDGLRVIIRGDVPEDGRQERHLSSPDGQKQGAVECYKNKRYITVTGNWFPNSLRTVEERPDSIWKEFFERSKIPVKGIQKNAKIKDLWNGKWQEHYGSQSDADLAMCRYLAEATDGDAAKIDSLFRQSKLIRAKWDVVHHPSVGRTYGQETIRIAVESYEKSYHLTDTGDAKRFAKLIADEARHCAGKWYIWDGKRLAEDNSYRIYTLMDRLCAAVVQDAKESDSEERKKLLISHARSLESKSRTEAVISLARAREPMPVLVENLDKNPHAFNCMNGIMIKGNLRPHAFEEMMTKISPVAYDPRADSPTWDAFLKDSFDDQEMIDYLARAVGYSMTGLTSEQCIFFIYGLGANGKSTFLNTIQYIMGDYARTIPTELLMVGKDQHPTALADLRGIRMALASEVGEGRRFNEQLIKWLTGEETITARRMHQDFFEFSPTFKLWISGNHKPTIRGTDYAIRRRFQLVPFTKTVEKSRQDPFLKDKLRLEIDGILNWCVKGYLEWLKQGVNPPKQVIAATEQYFEDQDSVAHFIAEQTETEKGCTLNQKGLYDRYASFTKSRNDYLLSMKLFNAKLLDRGFERDIQDGIAIWINVKYKKDQSNFEVVGGM